MLTSFGSASAQLHSPHNNFSGNYSTKNSGGGFVDSERSEQITFHFRNDSSQLDTLYANNASSYARLRNAIASGEISNIDVHGAASPLGNEEYNRKLSLRRANSIRDAIKQIPHAEEISITVYALGEEWTAFTEHIEAHYHHSNRNIVLDILHAEIPNSEKKSRLWNLDQKHNTWYRLVNKHMDTARKSVGVVTRKNFKLPEECLATPELPQWAIVPLSLDEATPHSEIADRQTLSQVSTAEPDSAPTSAPKQTESDSFERKMIMAARTNLLVPALNFGIEVPIRTNWSVGAEYYYPWIWPAPDNRNCFELLAWNIEGRYWFGKERTIAQRLQGHAVGVYAGGGYYDVQRNFKGHQGEFADVGIDYTYALPVAKGKLHFEFSVGVGYIYSKARPYNVAEKGGELLWHKQLKNIHYFGPTRLNVSLTVPIFQRIKREGGNE